MLAIVEQQQHPSLDDVRSRRPLSSRPSAVGDRSGDVAARFQRANSTNQTPSAKSAQYSFADFQREAGLARPTRPDQGDQPVRTRRSPETSSNSLFRPTKELTAAGRLPLRASARGPLPAPVPFGEIEVRVLGEDRSFEPL